MKLSSECRDCPSNLFVKISTFFAFYHSGLLNFADNVFNGGQILHFCIIGYSMLLWRKASKGLSLCFVEYPLGDLINEEKDT
jgi:hypothetical protein